MKKTLLIFLAVLVVGLLIANIAVLTLGIKRLAEKASPAEAPREVVQVPASTPARSQIKQATLNQSFIAIPGVSNAAPASASRNEESIGAQAGKTVGELQQQTEKSYEALNQQAQETAIQLEKTSEEAMKVLNQQTAQTVENLQVVWADILQRFNVELEKFNEELKKKQTT